MRSTPRTAAKQKKDQTSGTYFKQSGFNIALSGGVVDTALAAYGAAKRGSEVQDGRLAAMYGAQAAYGASDAYAGAQGMQAAGSASGAAAASGANIRITVGSQSNSSETHVKETTHRGSTIQSGGNIIIGATGDGQGNGGDLNIQGSRVDGQNVGLSAARDLNITSSEDTYSSETRSKSQGGEIGVAISASQNGAAAGLYVSANVARGKGDGEGTTHNESLINARGTFTFSSGRDTTLQGAQLTANQVIGNVARDLTVTSEQDTDSYKNENMAVQGSMTIGYGFDGQASASYSKISSDYASVKEQTGIQAGSGGFDITVGGHTQLNGAALASTADADRNRLSTGSLGVANIQNKAEYSAFSVSLSTSGGQAGSAPAGSNVYSAQGGGGGISPGMGIPQHEDSSNTTKSGIAAGTVDIRNGDNGALESLDRDVTKLQQIGLKEIFDEQKVQEAMELGQVGGGVLMRVGGTIASQMQKDAIEDLAAGKQSGDPEAIAAATARLQSWSDGGTNKAILHGLMGAGIAALGGGDALQGALGAAGVEKSKQAMANYLVANGVEFGSAEYNTFMELGSVTLGGLFGGGAGASTALAGDQFNRQLHPDEVAWINANANEFALLQNISVEEARRRLTVEGAAQVDGFIRGLLPNVDQEALSFLSTRSPTFDWGYGFTELDDDKYNNFNYNGDALVQDMDAFRQVYNALGSAGIGKETLQNAYNRQLLTYGTEQRGKDGQGVLGFLGVTSGVGAAGAVVLPWLTSACLSNAAGCTTVVTDVLMGDALGGYSLTPVVGSGVLAKEVVEEVGAATASKADDIARATLTTAVDAPKPLTLAEQIGMLREAGEAGGIARGNYSLGAAGAADADMLGKAWVGPGYRVTSDGVGLVSADGLRVYRFPAKKFSPYAATGTQANFVQLQLINGKPKIVSNGHLNINPGG